MPRKFWSQWDDFQELSKSAQIANDLPSMTLQGPAEEADVNWIARHYGLSEKAVPPEALDPRFYGDMTEVPDLATALDIVRDAQAKFDALPVRLRDRFNQDPGRLWAFVNDPENADEAVRLGLLMRPPEPPVAPTEPVVVPA